MLEAGDMKEFYRFANQVLRLRTSHPVVNSIKKGVEGAEEIIEKRELVYQEIADYFKQVYKRPAHMEERHGGLDGAS